MPPKKGKKGGKRKGSGKDRPPALEPTKDQLWEEGLRLQEELDRVREEKKNFQLERNKCQAAWDITKRDLEEIQRRIRFKRRQKEEDNEKRREEIADYQLRLKNMLGEQNNTVLEQKMDNACSCLIVRNQLTEKETELLHDYEQLLAIYREKKLFRQTCMKELELNHQAELLKMSRFYERKIRDIEDSYNLKRKALVEEEESRLQQRMTILDGRIQNCIDLMMSQHMKNLHDLKLVWKDEEEGEEQDSSKHKPESKKKKSAQKKKGGVKKTAGQEVALKVRERKKEEFSLKEMLERRRARQEEIKKELLEEMVKNELLLRACNQVEQECLDLQTKETNTILDIQKRCGVKEKKLERTMAEVTEVLEKAEAKLCSMLMMTSTDPDTHKTATAKLQEIFESKQAHLDALQDVLDRDCKEYDQLLQSCKNKLRASGVPLVGFSFKSASDILKAAKSLPDVLQMTSCTP